MPAPAAAAERPRGLARAPPDGTRPPARALWRWSVATGQRDEAWGVSAVPDSRTGFFKAGLSSGGDRTDRLTYSTAKVDWEPRRTRKDHLRETARADASIESGVVLSSLFFKWIILFFNTPSV